MAGTRVVMTVAKNARPRRGLIRRPPSQPAPHLAACNTPSRTTHLCLQQVAPRRGVDREGHAQESQDDARNQFSPLAEPRPDAPPKRQAEEGHAESLDGDVGEGGANGDMQDAQREAHGQLVKAHGEGRQQKLSALDRQNLVIIVVIGQGLSNRQDADEDQEGGGSVVGEDADGAAQTRAPTTSPTIGIRPAKNAKVRPTRHQRFRGRPDSPRPTDTASVSRPRERNMTVMAITGSSYPDRP